MPENQLADYDFPADLPAVIRETLLAAERPSLGAVVDAAYASLGFPDVDPRVPMRAEPLTPAQRAFVKTIVECGIWSMNLLRRCPERGDLPRWLGLEPPGPLERMVEFELKGERREEPLWRAVRLLRSEDDLSQTKLAKELASHLPLAERLECWGLCSLRFPPPWGLEPHDFFAIDYEPEEHLPLVGNDAGEWAGRFLDALLASPGRRKDASTFLPFLALFRAGRPIEPRWYGLLPISGSHDHVDEILFSIPEAQRAEAFGRWLDRMLFPSQVAQAVTRVLPRAPLPALVARALAAIPEATGSARKRMKLLRTAAGTHAELLALIDAAEAERGPPLELTLLSVRKPTTLAELGEIDRAQLLEAGKRYHGKKVDLETLMAPLNDGEASINFGLTVLAIGDAKGKHVYDGWLYMADSGAFFAAGKTRVVAERMQFGIECKNDKLADALETLLAEPLEPRAPRRPQETRS